MDINTKVGLTPDEEGRLERALSCKSGEVKAELEKYAQAAIREYVEMFLGDTMLRSPEDREQRLFLLIIHSLDGAMPSESWVARKFNLTPGKARGLINATLSRFRLRLTAALAAEAKRVLGGRHSNEDNCYYAEIDSKGVVDALNGLLAAKDGRLSPISKVLTAGTTYKVAEDSYDALEKLFP